MYDDEDFTEDERRERAHAVMVQGAVLALIGIAIAVATYSDAAVHNGRWYALVLSTIITGIIRVVRGMAALP